MNLAHVWAGLLTSAAPRGLSLSLQPLLPPQENHAQRSQHDQRPGQEREMNEETWARIQRQNEGALRETADDTMFRWLAMSYAHSHLTMTESYRGSCHADDITGGQGIINRASWKPVVGSEYGGRDPTWASV